MFSHSFKDLASLLANRLAMVVIASGNPPHFLRILAEISSNCGGQTFSDPNTLLTNNHIVSLPMRGFITPVVALTNILTKEPWRASNIRVSRQVRVCLVAWGYSDFLHPTEIWNPSSVC
jgi:hypothetical protein